MLADALLRSVTGTTALLRVTSANTDSSQSEVGLVATTFAEVVVSPVVMRTLRPSWKEGGEPKWELLISATENVSLSTYHRDNYLRSSAFYKR